MRMNIVSVILTFGFIGHAMAGTHWVQRPDDMVVYWFHDVDQHDDRVRILYSTTPSLQQGQADPDGWRTNVYLVEARADGSVNQRRLFSRNEHIAALLLRRGHDQVFALRRPEQKGDPQHMELWSTSDGLVSSSEPAPHLPGTRGAGSSDLTQSIPTDDGNLFVSFMAGNPTTVLWYKLSPEGAVLGAGEYAHEGVRLQPGGWFPARGGGIGLSLQFSPDRGVDRLTTDIDTPITRSVGGRTLAAHLAAETRLLVFDGDGKHRWQSPPLERRLTWGGQMQIPNDLPPAENMRQLREQMRTVERTEIDLGARRTLVEISRFKRSTDGIKPVPGGYGVLATTVANRRLEPPAHGPSYLELGEDGRLRREVYLGDIAEELDARFEDFVVDQDGLLVAGTRRARGAQTQVTRVSLDGERQWTRALEAPADIDGIAGAETNVWVFGHSGRGPSTKTLLWLEKVESPATGR
jgi:hypothetical protein